MKKQYILSLLILLAMTGELRAQIPVYTIMHSIETNVRNEFPGHKEWGVTELQKNIRRSISPIAAQSLQMSVAGSETLSAPDVYDMRQSGSLLFGKMYSCGECPQMHVALIASAAAITEDGVCLTNYHVVHPIVAGGNAAARGDSVYFVADRDGQCYPLTAVLAYSSDDDMAAIRVDTKGVKLSAIPLGETARTGQHINLISHPKQMLFMMTQGYVTRNVVYNYPQRPVIDLMEITADFAEGSSGAPLLDDKGNLVGMVRGTNTIYHDTEKRDNVQMVVKTCVPVKSLRRLLGIK